MTAGRSCRLVAPLSVVLLSWTSIGFAQTTGATSLGGAGHIGFQVPRE